MSYYERPQDVTGTVFDPSDDSFGPIMRDIQAGDFETAAQRLSGLTSERAPFIPRDHTDLSLRYPPDSGLAAPNEECKNNLDRICLIIDQYVEQNVTDADSAMLDLVTDCLIANRFLYGASPDELLDRAQRAYFSQLADANVWA